MSVYIPQVNIQSVEDCKREFARISQILNGNLDTLNIKDGTVGSIDMLQTGVTAGTYAPPNSITVDSKGRITNIT